MRSTQRPSKQSPGLQKYIVHEWIGGGGTAQVWRATHRATGLQVAIKTLKHSSKHAKSLHELFYREAQLIAGLDHPNVVDIMDFGIQSSELAMPKGETLPAGTPFMAMEHLHGGSAHRCQGRLSWKQVSEIAFQLLDGLAHAHARGVVHLDLKPANILLHQPIDSSSRGILPRVKIADFGISTWIGKTMSRRGLGGTPTYAAPEQIRGAWRDVGPWTDFYALGCTLWALLSGSTPYRPRTWQEAMQEHLHSSPPPFKPRTAVPEGVEELLLQLLEKQPERRFQRAAEIAQRLHDFDQPATEMHIPEPFSLEPESEPDPSETPTELPTQLFSMVNHSRTSGEKEVDSTPSLASESLRSRDKWERVRPSALPQQHAAAGLSLCRYKVPKFVGRQALRDQLWAGLVHVREKATPHTFVLKGQRGIGMSRILKWLGERSHELGMAQVLHVQMQEHRSAIESLSHSIRHWLRLEGLSARVSATRIRRELLACGVDDPRLEKRLNTVLCEDLQTPALKNSLRIIERFLIAKSRTGAMVLLVEDAQYFDGIKDLLEILVQQCLPQDTGGLLCVIGVQHAGTSAPPLGLIDYPECLDIIDVPALSKTEHLALIRQIVPLEPELANELAVQTYRNPSLAITQLMEWVDSGLLIPGPTGFQLSKGTALSFGDEREFWKKRLAPFAEAIESLEIAAAWGSRWSHEIWQLHVASDDLQTHAEAFQKAGLIHWQDGAWSFTSKQLQVYLEEHATEFNRWRAHHDRCLQLIEKHRNLSWRIGRHLFGAGRYNEALQRLMEETKDCIDNHAFHEASAAIATCKKTYEALDLTQPDRRGAEILLLEARLAAFSGNPSLAVSKADDLLQLATERLWPEFHAHALRIKGRCMLESPNSNQAMRFLKQAYDDALGHRDEELANWILIDQVRLMSYRQANTEAIPLARQALKNSESLGNLQMRLNAQLALSFALHRAGQLTESVEVAQKTLQESQGTEVPTHLLISTKARLASTMMALKKNPAMVASLYQELADVYEENGHLPRQIDALHNLGSIYRWDEDLENAERCYRKALVLSQGASETSQAFSNLNVGLLLVLKGQSLAAGDFTEPVLKTALKLNNTLLEAAARAISLCVDCERQDWRSVSLELVRLEALLSQMRMIPHDLTLLLNVASEQLRAMDQTNLRQQLAQVARTQSLVA